MIEIGINKEKLSGETTNQTKKKISFFFEATEILTHVQYKNVK